MFGYRLVKNEDYKYLANQCVIANKLQSCFYWFHKTPRIKELLWHFSMGTIHTHNIAETRDKLAASVIELTEAEIQSKHTRVDWAEDLIRQLPPDHHGRNSWLLNYGSGRSGE